MFSLNKISFTKYLLFNNQKQLLTPISDTGCSGDDKYQLSYILENKYYKIDSNFLLTNITSNIVDSTGKPYNYGFKDSTKYYMIIFWASWMGKLNKMGYMTWYEQAKTIKEKYNLEIISINVDLLKFINYENLN